MATSNIGDKAEEFESVKIAKRLRNAVFGLTPSELAYLIVKYQDRFRQSLEIAATQDPRVLRDFPQVGDQQTGLYGKIFFEKVLLPKKFKQALERGLPISLAIMDLDRFKEVNTRYGLEAGDEVLANAAREISKEEALAVANNFRIHEDRRKYINLTRKEDKRLGKDRRDTQARDLVTILEEHPEVDAGRVGGGEEFGILYLGTGVEGAAKSLQRLLYNLKTSPVQVGKERILVTASAGLISYPEFNDYAKTPEDLLSEAKKWVRVAKDEGKDRIRTPYRVYFARV